jgi:hypothetical protein
MGGVEEPVGDDTDEVDEVAGEDEWLTPVGDDQQALQDAMTDLEPDEGE